MLIGIACALLLTGHLQRQVQPQGTPSQYLATNKWDVASKGPLLFMPQRRLAVPDSHALEGGFRIFNCGSIHTICPVQMTVIDPDYKQAPNLYEGLPRKMKVLYLVSTLNKSQFEMACASGIGMNSLNQEQQAVYRSILPSVFKYQTTLVSNPFDRNAERDPGTETTLTTEQESQVLLKIHKELSLGVRLGTDGGFSAISGQRWDRYKIGSRVSSRIDVATEDKNSSFGLEIRKTSLNELKPSDLDYKNSILDAQLPLAASTNVKDLCLAVSNLTHLVIIADARFQDEKVETLGGSARAGDVLKGLALGLTGTYRKVGNTYILTSDKEGIGTKMTKLAFWHWNLSQISRHESEKWSSQIGANPALHSISYSADDSLTPNDAMRKFMETDFEQGSKTMPASLLSPAWLKLLNSKDNHFGAPLRTDVAEPWESVFWSFVVPGPETLTWEDELDDMNAFSRYAERHPVQRSGPEPKRAALKDVPNAAFIYVSDSPDDASHLPELVQDYGFSQLWLQTTNRDALSAAIEAGKAIGVKVRLVVAPFTATGNVSVNQIDLSILGMGYTESRSLIDGSEWVQESNNMFSTNLRKAQFLDEEHGQLAKTWQKLVALAKVPGSAGVVVLSGTPAGYEKQSDWAEYSPPQLAAPIAMGYTTGLREKFARANAVDPVDLLEVRYESDLNPLDQSISSFGYLNNYRYGKVSENPPSLRDKWDRFRFDTNDAQLRKFLSGFSSPTLLEWRLKLHDTSLNWEKLVSLHAVGTDIETLTDDPYSKPIPEDTYFLQGIGFPISDGATSYLRRHITSRIKRKAPDLAIDMRAVPATKLKQSIASIFIAKE